MSLGPDEVKQMSDFARSVHPKHFDWSQDAAQYTITDAAVKAATELFPGDTVNKALDLFILPFDRVYFKFQFHGREMHLLATQLETGILVTHHDPSGGPNPSYQVDVSSGQAEITRVDGQNISPVEHERISLFGIVVCYLQCPDMLEVVVADWRKLNKKRARLGRPPKTPPTVIKPSREMTLYLDSISTREPGEVQQHPVARHPHLYHYGKRGEPRTSRYRWVGPYMRGNPEHGTKTASYLVKGNDDA